MISPFRRLNRRAAVTWDRLYGSPGPVKTYSGKPVNERTALKYSVVWACATIIADAVSSLPPEAVTEDTDKGIVKSVEVPRWIRKPHPELRRNEVWNQILLSLLLWGDGYALFTRRESDGMITGLRTLDPGTVQCEWNKDRPGYRTYKVDNGPDLTSADVFHAMGPSLPGEPTGLGCIAQAREAIGLGLTLEEFGARYFGQGSMAKVVIKTPKQLDATQARDLVNTYERFHKGAGNWHRPAVLSGGGDIQSISIPPDDAQFLQTREFQALDVARWFRVPPHRVNIMTKQSSWGSGLAEENTAMVQHTFRPWIMRLEAALTAYAPGGEDSGIRIRLNDSVLLRGSFKEQVDAWAAAVTAQVATPNEARKAIGLDPINGGDELVTPAAPTLPKDDGNKPKSKKDSGKGGTGANEDD